MVTWKGGVLTDIIFYKIISIKEATKARAWLNSWEGEEKGKEIREGEKQEKQDKPNKPGKRIPQNRASTGAESDVSYRDLC